MYRLDDELIGNLFGVTTRSTSESEVVRRSSNFTAIQAEKTEILDPKKAHNIAIQLRARGLAIARSTVCEALLAGESRVHIYAQMLYISVNPSSSDLADYMCFGFAGDGLGQENLEVLVKMTPTDEELTRFQEYQGDQTLLGPADRFVQGILQIPSAFERLRTMLFVASYWEELHQIQETIAILEVLMIQPSQLRPLFHLKPR